MKKTTYWMIVVCAMFFQWVSAQQKATLKGVVTDNEGKSLAGATVLINPGNRGTITNSHGNYQINELEPGNYALQVTFLGYETTSKDVTLSAGTNNFDISLDEESIIGEETVIQATRAGDKDPFTFTNVTGEELKEVSNVADIPYLLELTPSVVATSESGTGLGYTGIRIRGSGENRINITINGVPLNDAESLGAFWVNLPDFASSVDNVQIQRGVGTSTNGSAAFGATINFQTENMSADAFADIQTSFGSFNTFKRSISAGTGLLNDKFAFDVRLSQINSDGYIKRGFVDHTAAQISGAYFGDKTVVKANVLIGEQHTGITWWGVPDYIVETDRRYNPAGGYEVIQGIDTITKYYDGQTDNYWQNHYQLLTTHAFSDNFNINLTLHATTGKGYYEQYRDDDEFESYGISPVTLGTDTAYNSDMIRQKWLDNIFYGGIFSLNYRFGENQISVGASINQYDGDHFGNILWTEYNAGIPKDYEWYFNNGKKSDISSFIKGNFQVTPQLNFYADIQQRLINYRMKGPDDDLVDLDQKHKYLFFNPKTGLFYNLNEKNSLYFSYAMAHREPTRADLKDAAKADSIFIYPKPEQLHDFELGYDRTTSNYTFSANLFYMHYKDQLVLTGEVNDVGYPLMTNVPESYRTGIELAFGWNIIKNLYWQANATLSQNKIKNHKEFYYGDTLDFGNSDISYSPSVIAGSMLKYRLLDLVEVGFISKFVGKQYFDNTMSDARSLDPYFLNHLSFGYQSDIKKVGTLKLQFLINNIFEEVYSNNAYGGYWFEDGTEYTWAYYFPQAGRHYMITLGLEF